MPECLLPGRPAGSTERVSGTRSAIVLARDAARSARERAQRWHNGLLRIPSPCERFSPVASMISVTRGRDMRRSCIREAMAETIWAWAWMSGRLFHGLAFPRIRAATIAGPRQASCPRRARAFSGKCLAKLDLGTCIRSGVSTSLAACHLSAFTIPCDGIHGWDRDGDDHVRSTGLASYPTIAITMSPLVHIPSKSAPAPGESIGIAP
jgi:hypothetical protein